MVKKVKYWKAINDKTGRKVTTSFVRASWVNGHWRIRRKVPPLARGWSWYKGNIPRNRKKPKRRSSGRVIDWSDADAQDTAYLIRQSNRKINKLIPPGHPARSSAYYRDEEGSIDMTEPSPFKEKKKKPVKSGFDFMVRPGSNIPKKRIQQNPFGRKGSSRSYDMGSDSEESLIYPVRKKKPKFTKG